MEPHAVKNDTIKLRMDANTADMLERARTYAGLDKSKFIRQSIREKAQDVIAEHEQTRFSASDWHHFFEHLEQPEPATERMERAAKLYHTIVSDDAEI